MFIFTDIIMIKKIFLILTYYVHILIKKIIGYRSQDKLGHRAICKDYINSEWFMDRLGATCNMCNCELIYNIQATGAITSNITADRIDNNISHSLNNCKLCCVRCNAGKSNFNKFGKREIKNTIEFKIDDNINFIDDVKDVKNTIEFKIDDNIDFINDVEDIKIEDVKN
jgi:hypothetical protein